MQVALIVSSVDVMAAISSVGVTSLLEYPMLCCDIESTGDLPMSTPMKAVGMVLLDTDGQLKERLEVVMKVDRSQFGARCWDSFWSTPKMQVVLNKWQASGQEVSSQEGMWQVYKFIQQMYRKYPDMHLATDNGSFDGCWISTNFDAVLGLPEWHYALDKTVALPDKYGDEVVNLAAQVRTRQVSAEYKISVIDVSDYACGLFRGAGLDPEMKTDDIVRELGIKLEHVHDHTPLSDSCHMAGEFVARCMYVERHWKKK